MQPQPATSDHELPNTQSETKNEIKRLKGDLWHRGFYFLAATGLLPLDVAVFYIYWNWFVVRLGVRSVSYGLAFALWVMWRFLLHPSPQEPTIRKTWPKDPKLVWPSMIQTYANRAFTLIVGALAYAFILHV